MTSQASTSSRRSALAAIGATLIAGAAPCLGAAQTRKSALPVADIVARNIAARGGAPAWRAVRTLSMSGLMDVGRITADSRKLIEETHAAPGRPRKRLHAERVATEARPDTVVRLPYLIEFRRPRQMRVELKLQDTTAVQVYDGATGWKLRPYLGRHEVEPYSPYEQRLAASQQELDGPLADHAAKGTRVEAAGLESIDGRDAHRLKLTLKNGDVLHLWVDAQTFLDARLSVPHAFAGREHLLTTAMSDYRRVGGLMLPFRLEDRIDGTATTQRIDIEQVAVNPPLGDVRFARPA